MKIIERPASVFVIAASVLAMSAAFAAQYGLGWKPCELCLAQRIPILLAGLVACGGLYPDLTPLPRRILAVLCAILFAVASGIAVYHVGVEQHWWASTCAGGSLTEDVSKVDFAQALSQPLGVRCDEPAFSWHGITMAGLNIIYSGAVALTTLGLAIRGKV